MPFIDRKEQAELAEKAAKELAEAMLMEGMVDTEGLGLGGEGGGGGIEGVVVMVKVVKVVGVMMEMEVW